MRNLIFITCLLVLTTRGADSSITDHTGCNPQQDATCVCNPGLTGDDCTTDIDECLSSFCSEHGTCVNTHGSYYCDCDPGFNGLDCGFDINECGQPDPPYCGVHSICVDTYGSYTCECEPGYTGDECEIEINECELNNCANGICTDLVNDYRCDCFMGWTGTQCEEDIDECNVPGREFGLCDETGTNRCIEGNSTYSCACVVGFTGDNCSVDIDECALGLCLNGANCTDHLFGIYECSCVPGFAGDRCEIDLTPCDPDPCQYNSTCYDRDNFRIHYPQGNGDISSLRLGEYFCECLDGYSGKNCSNECPSDPCMNSGECVDTEESFICNCLPGFSGLLCEMDLDFCTPATCHNGGNCSEGIGDIVTCACVHGFNGTNCENDLPFCRPDSCLNNGTCIEGRGTETSCDCLEGFSGVNCEEDLDYCTNTTCHNGGTCIEGLGIVVTCFCPNGTVGDYCNTLTPEINRLVLIVVIIVAVLALFLLVCFVSTLCISAYWEARRGKLSKRAQMNLWTLGYHSPATVAALEDTISEQFNYRDVELRYVDTMSQMSFESQTATMRFTLGRSASVASQPTGRPVRTPSTRSRGRVARDKQLGELKKEDIVDMLESNLTTFKPA